MEFANFNQGGNYAPLEEIIEDIIFMPDMKLVRAFRFYVHIMPHSSEAFENKKIILKYLIRRINLEIGEDVKRIIFRRIKIDHRTCRFLWEQKFLDLNINNFSEIFASQDPTVCYDGHPLNRVCFLYDVFGIKAKDMFLHPSRFQDSLKFFKDDFFGEDYYQVFYDKFIKSPFIEYNVDDFIKNIMPVYYKNGKGDIIEKATITKDNIIIPEILLYARIFDTCFLFLKWCNNPDRYRDFVFSQYHNPIQRQILSSFYGNIDKKKCQYIKCCQ